MKEKGILCVSEPPGIGKTTTVDHCLESMKKEKTFKVNQLTSEYSTEELKNIINTHDIFVLDDINNLLISSNFRILLEQILMSGKKIILISNNETAESISYLIESNNSINGKFLAYLFRSNVKELDLNDRDLRESSTKSGEIVSELIPGVKTLNIQGFFDLMEPLKEIGNQGYRVSKYNRN